MDNSAVKIVASTRDDSIGIGTLLVLELESLNKIVQTEDTMIVTDINGEEFEIYDYYDLSKLTNSDT